MTQAIRVEDLLAMAVIISGRYLLNVDQVRVAGRDQGHLLRAAQPF